MADTPNTSPRLPFYMTALDVLQVCLHHVEFVVDLSDRMLKGGPVASPEELARLYYAARYLRRAIEEARP